ncbi:UNVERIFIED_CONTAM: hypothetical protein HDU68_008967 [Siphonaria sp. JEL0065]|nr:hypothetical protein HDU68_008967 [Siphonaria sp. JEL0065]
MSTTENTLEANLCIPLAESQPIEPLLSGFEAASLIGDRSISNVILQPSEGEFILASSAYLSRNPHFGTIFKAIISKGSSDSTLGTPFKLTPPFPTEFRCLLACIYANSQEYVYSILGVNNFGSLIMNAQYFRDGPTITACVFWFAEKWSRLMEDDCIFSCAVIDLETLKVLLTVIASNENKLRVVLKWANDYTNDEGGKQDLTAFVEANIDFKTVSLALWMELMAKYLHGVGSCVSSESRAKLFESASRTCKMEVQCQKCNNQVTVDIFGDPLVVCSVLKGSIYSPSFDHIATSLSDSHEREGVYFG